MTTSGPDGHEWPDFCLAGRTLGPGRPVVIAEAGINHDGDVTRAHRLIDAAHEAGADGVKFQNYRTEDFVSDRTLTYEYGVPGGRVTQSQFDMFKERELPIEALRELREHARDTGLVFMSTPTSDQGVAELVRIDADAIKNGSDYLVHLPLIAAMAASGLPTVLSTGMSTHGEISDAVAAFVSAGGRQLVLLHCTSRYPTPADDVNLRRIPALAAAFGCPVGFSDHTEGTTAAAVSAAFGAVFIEKHFTLDKNGAGPDHWFSADPLELAQLVRDVRFSAAALGSADVRPTAAEEQSRRHFRLSCVAARDLPEGSVLAAVDVAFRRPGTGLPPKNVGLLVGRTLTRQMRAGEVLTVEALVSPSPSSPQSR